MQILLAACVIVFCVPHGVYADEVESTFVRATVTRIVSEERTVIPATDVVSFLQILEAKTDSGEIITIENDRVLLKEGDSFFATYIDTSDGRIHSVHEPDRRGVLILGVALFALVTVLIGGTIGLRSLIALVGAGVVVFVFLLPQLASGVSPVPVTVISSAVILAFAMTVTHGLSRTTLAAFVASVLTIFIAVLIGHFFVDLARLSGFTDDASVFLNLSTGGTLNMSGLLLAAIIIGTLGIIDDLAVTQVSTVSELRNANSALSARELYIRAMKVGKEHLGAVTNTLVFAYAGAALPLLLLFVISPTPSLYLLNSEIIAAEIIRAIVGGIALALILPIGTALGAIAAKTDPVKDHGGKSAHF